MAAPLPAPDGLLFAAGAAALAGLASSLHCFTMCGPLACHTVSRAPVGRRLQAAGAYQALRIASYAVAGALLGLVGSGVVGAVEPPSAPWLAWAAALLLVSSALGLGDLLPRVPGAARLVQLGARAGAGFAPTTRSGAWGALTALLPCGLLYGVYAAALVSGSVAGGAVLAGAFALGGVPSLVLAQLQARWMTRLPRGSTFVLRRVVPVVAAVLLVYRATRREGAGDCCR